MAWCSVKHQGQLYLYLIVLGVGYLQYTYCTYIVHIVIIFILFLQLDTWFGTKKKEKGRGGGGQLPRPHSETDFNELEEQELFVEQLDADEKFLNEKFEEMLVCIQNSSGVNRFNYALKQG
jgi:hypothetical protein